MRVLIWHAWALEGSGSSVFTATVTQVLRRTGHQVLLLCQEPHPERFEFVDSWGTVGRDVSRLESTGAQPAAGRAILLRPDLGPLLPGFLSDRYDGVRVTRFVDLSDRELTVYLERNVQALRAAAASHGFDALIAGHALPGAVIARRAVGPGAYAAVVHGSELEYAVKLQPRYAAAAREGLDGARAVAGPSADLLRRTLRVAPSVAGRTRVVRPGVDGALFRPGRRSEALTELAAALEDHGTSERPCIDRVVEEAFAQRDGDAIDALSLRYEEPGADAGRSARLRALADGDGPLVGYLGRLVPQKGVDLLVGALAYLPRARALISGFGASRGWLASLISALDRVDLSALGWLREAAGLRVELTEAMPAAGIGERITFAGRLTHRQAAAALAALDVLVVPSIPPETFGMVAAEAAAAGALPLVARHSGLAEVAAELEGAVGRPHLFSYRQDAGGPRCIAAGIRQLLDLHIRERRDLASALRTFVTTEWSWQRTVEDLLDLAR